MLRENLVRVKLIKLIINKFEGSNLDWLKLWSQFETKIDYVDIKTVSKFSYLKVTSFAIFLTVKYNDGSPWKISHISCSGF